jgi:hypothetical protein
MPEQRMQGKRIALRSAHFLLKSSSKTCSTSFMRTKATMPARQALSLYNPLTEHLVFRAQTAVSRQQSGTTPAISLSVTLVPITRASFAYFFLLSHRTVSRSQKATISIDSLEGAVKNSHSTAKSIVPGVTQKLKCKPPILRQTEFLVL